MLNVLSKIAGFWTEERFIYSPPSQCGFNYFNSQRVFLSLLALGSSRRGDNLLPYVQDIGY